MNVLLLRFDAPMLSFGAPIVDNRGVIQAYPALSMLSGMLGNALGYDHSQFEQLEQLQDALDYASRQDRRGERMRDFQTVDFGQDYLQGNHAWTTRHAIDGRSTDSTHIRERDYWVDSAHTVALTLGQEPTGPSLDDLERALKSPERPLFIGRKTCVPASALFLARITAKDLKTALEQAPLHERADAGPRYRAWWPCAPEGDPDADISRPVTDRRDWRNQIHVGERWIAEGSIQVDSAEKEAPHDKF